MNKKYDYSHWGFDLLGCVGIIYLFICNYQILLEASDSNSKGKIITNIFILLNRYLGKLGVYVLLVILFLWFFISAIRKIMKNK